MDPQNSAEKRCSLRNDKQSSNAKNKSSKVTLQDIQVVQNLIERCLQLYMSRDEVVNTLLDRARIEPEFTSLVWQKLEEQNAEFFKAYHIRMKLKEQIDMYNQLLEQQYHLMKQQERMEFERAPVQNDMHHMPVNNISVEYPIMQNVTPSTHLSQNQFHGHHIWLSQSKWSPCCEKLPPSPTEVCERVGPADTVPFFPAGNMKLVGASSPVEEASNGHFPFTPDTSGLNLDSPMLDSAFASDIADLERMRLGADGWDFGFFQDFGPAGNYSGSKFQPSELDINLDSAEQNDMVDGVLLVDGPLGQGTQPGWTPK